MASSYKVLGQVKPLALTTTTLYTATATSAVCSTFTVCNLGPSTTYRIAVSPGGAVVTDAHYIVYEAVAEQYNTTFLTLGVTLANTDVLSVYAGTANVVFNLFGVENS